MTATALALLMILLAAAVVVATPTPSKAPATVQTTATIRVVQGVRLKFDAATNPGAPAARDAVLQLTDGTSQPAILIEFQ